MYVLPRIKEIRKSRNLSQAQVAAKIGMEQTQYSRYERGENKIKVNVLIDICKVLNISSDYILELSDDPTPRYKNNVNNQVNINANNNFGNVIFKND